MIEIGPNLAKLISDCLGGLFVLIVLYGAYKLFRWIGDEL
jgi:hypothetical protein